ncbi:RCC1 domain-containing protein [Archangium sp.]|uniref:RCC1 domain-containing protein n=1 Tax=Archangium sp. TaxID=1872627 RepID=UPI00389B0698
MKRMLGGSVRAALICALMTMACGLPEVGPSDEEAQAVLAPGTTSAALMATANYDSTLKVPRCLGVASGCDSGSLVNGRGPVGPELNAPNTLGGTCADGAGGTYHSDESLDRVKVYTTDGTDLAPGKQVTIEVEVWAWSSFTSDALDLYYAADASNPTWNFITTLVPTGAGVQTLRANYTLPAGGSTQAVRAVFRYGGTASVCSGSSYDERDDLAFALGAAHPKPTRIAGGWYFSLELRQDGTVWGWGTNQRGQLGDGTTLQRNTPVRVMGLDNVESIAAADRHSLVLKKDGTVWAWGGNDFGQLGDGSFTDRYTPVQVVGLTGVVAIAAGGVQSLALKQDGTVWAWGYNGTGALGDGTTIDRNTPVQVVGLTGVVAIAEGDTDSLAVRSDGSVWAWGYNYFGELGDGTTSMRTTPVQVSGLTGVVAVSVGNTHSMALKLDGTVWAWGSNGDGSLGDGTTIQRTTPVQVLGLSGVTAIDAGVGFSLVLKQDGTAWAWGYNGWAQLGDGTTTRRMTPVQVPGLSGVATISTGAAHSLALKQDNSAWAWGYNGYGQLGDGTTTQRSSPVRVLSASGSTVQIEPLTYSASNTNSAQQNTFNRTFTLNAGDMLEVGTCNLTGATASGDTYLRLFGTSATQVVYNDDSCGGVASYLQYTATSSGSYELRAGCFSSGSCSGTVVFKVTPGS